MRCEKKACQVAAMAVLSLLGAAPAFAIAISNVRIVSVDPNPIPCGSTATVTVQFDYFVPAHGNTLPQTGTVQIRESDPFWEADETLAQGTVTIGVGDPQQGTKTVKLYVTCGPPDEDCKCPFGGGAGMDDEESPHEIYASVVKEWESDPSSDEVEVNCQKEDGTMACADSSLTPGGTAVASVNYIQTTGVAHMNLEIGYDPTLAVAINAWFDPAVAGLFEHTAVDVTVPGSVRFWADNPTDVLVEPFPMFIEFYSPPGTPFGSSPLGVTEASEFFDQYGQPLIVQHGSGHLVIVPPDSAPPVVYPDLMVADMGSDSLLGAAGAVFDDYLAELPGYVKVASAITLPDASFGFLGAVADVAPDGSFLLAEAGLNPCEPLVLVALDDAGNESAVELPFLVPVPEVSHVPQAPIVATQDVLPLMYPIAVAIPTTIGCVFEFRFF